ncbi:MAG TPA: hypothetical protein VN207_01440 [Ktedonobacteraceae bacterium]|nr:hypothetical protein [Ktedonobacteraceae bacterium]
MSLSLTKKGKYKEVVLAGIQELQLRHKSSSKQFLTSSFEAITKRDHPHKIYFAGLLEKLSGDSQTLDQFYEVAADRYHGIKQRDRQQNGEAVDFIETLNSILPSLSSLD